jgi:hypothetical protein
MKRRGTDSMLGKAQRGVKEILIPDMTTAAAAGAAAGVGPATAAAREATERARRAEEAQREATERARRAEEAQREATERARRAEEAQREALLADQAADATEGYRFGDYFVRPALKAAGSAVGNLTAQGREGTGREDYKFGDGMRGLQAMAGNWAGSAEPVGAAAAAPSRALASAADRGAALTSLNDSTTQLESGAKNFADMARGLNGGR